MADALIRWGLGLQIVFLVFLDWGTIAFMERSGETSMMHIIGLGVVNAVLLGGTLAMWVWMRACQREERQGLPTAVARRCESSSRSLSR